jgi:hypothetical protein
VDDLFDLTLDRFRAEDPKNADLKLTRCLVEVKKLPKFDPDMDDVEASAKALTKVRQKASQSSCQFNGASVGSHR